MNHGLHLRALVRCASLLSTALLAGCFETKQEFTLNPDGSGKVIHECVLQSTGGLGAVDVSPEGTKAAIREILEKSVGVDAWREVSYRRHDDGRLFFRGTAYFKNLSQFELPNQTALKFAWNKLGSGRVALVAREGTNQAHRTTPVLTNQPPVDLPAKLAQERANYQKIKPVIAAMLAGMKQESVFHLPGRLAGESTFPPGRDGAVKIQFEGAKLAAALDKLIADDEWAKQRLAAGAGLTGLTNSLLFDSAVNAILFGQSAPLRAELTGATQALFDYAAELAAAQVDDARLRSELGVGAAGGLDPSLFMAPAQGQPLKNLQVVGVRWVSAAGRPRELRPFDLDAGLTLSVFAELPGSVLALSDESRIDTAIAEDGADLLPTSATKRRLRFSRVATDRTSALIEISLAPPAPGVTVLKEISGQLKYTTIAGRRQVDLGFPALKPGAVGTALDARVVAIEAGSRKDGSQLVHLKLALRPEKIWTVWIAVDNAWQSLTRRSYSGGGDIHEFTYESPRAIPAAGRIVIETFDEIRAYESPFKVENVPLLGAGAKTM